MERERAGGCPSPTSQGNSWLLMVAREKEAEIFFRFVAAENLLKVHWINSHTHSWERFDGTPVLSLSSFHTLTYTLKNLTVRGRHVRKKGFAGREQGEKE